MGDDRTQLINDIVSFHGGGNYYLIGNDVQDCIRMIISLCHEYSYCISKGKLYTSMVGGLLSVELSNEFKCYLRNKKLTKLLNHV